MSIMNTPSQNETKEAWQRIKLHGACILRRPGTWKFHVPGILRERQAALGGVKAWACGERGDGGR